MCGVFAKIFSVCVVVLQMTYCGLKTLYVQMELHRLHSEPVTCNASMFLTGVSCCLERDVDEYALVTCFESSCCFVVKIIAKILVVSTFLHSS